MKKIKYLLTLLCCAVLWSSFSSAYNYSFTEIGSQDEQNSPGSMSALGSSDILANYDGFCVKLVPSRYHGSYITPALQFGYFYSVRVDGIEVDQLLNYENPIYGNVFQCYDKYYFGDTAISNITVEKGNSNSSFNFSGGKIYGYVSNRPVDCSQDSNYQSCLTSLNTCRGEVSTLSGSLTSCQSSLSTCQNNQDAGYLQCTESLSGCQSDLSSLQNYNSSLNDQLQECLSELPSNEECEGTGCDELLKYDWLFSLFRMNDDQMFSLPVANNIMLPQGYKAYVDSGSVVIGEINKRDLSMSDEEFDKVSSLYLTYFVGIGTFIFVCLFMYYIKKFIFKGFSVLYKKK